MELTISPHRHQRSPNKLEDRLYRLSAEHSWLIQGPAAAVAEVEAALAPFCERIGAALLVRFGNSVGSFEAGPLGRVVVHSGKWESSDFDAMLHDIAKHMAMLPFAPGSGGTHEHGLDTQPTVLYHQFVYLRHLLDPAAAPEDRLPAAIRLILARPHRKFERVDCWAPTGEVCRVEARGLLSMVTPQAQLARVHPSLAGPLARALNGHMPQRVQTSRLVSSVDVPENRFVKAFLDHALALVERMRLRARARKDQYFVARIEADCDRMIHTLLPLRRHALWDDVSALRRVPLESQVLQRRHGYREILRYYVRLQLSARLPLSAEAAKRLLELRDIATLYEMWCFFEVTRQVSDALGHPPHEARLVEVDDFGARVPRGLRITWATGVELFYNRCYSRTGRCRSYSLQLRPDVVLRLPNGDEHLFDAKFKVIGLSALLSEGVEDAEDDKIAERRGIYTNADIHKMHTYRDAIPSARSVWVLYPGTEFCFFHEQHGRMNTIEELNFAPEGVGAIGLQPHQTSMSITALVRRLLAC